MKLYREVKASERLPHKEGYYAIKLRKGFGPITNPYDRTLFNPSMENEAWHNKIESWLEPIEITEEEIAKIIASHVSYSALALNDTSSREIAKTILSKLNEQ